ncbi:hypothetical protein QIS74_13604 [Colletotrichum tabaci]|uniref:Protein kinase domain-containing protein n=1 Tax=Colletotrichum tabaci TaxID=1209068 RepID=A0AAV9SSC6_9PEZI
MAITAEDDSFAGKRHGLPKLRQRRTSAEQPLETLLDSTAVSDDALLLDACQAKQIDRFRDEIRLCQDEATRYRLCLQTRDDLLSQHSSLQFLIAAFDQVMLAECAEYHAWRKNRNKKPSSRVTNSREDDISVWERFVGVANEGMEIKYKCLSALTEVSRCWGLDKVQHYHWASKGEKYCKVLRTAARAVPEWAEAAIKLNRRDLDTLKAWSYKQAYVKQNGRGQHSLLFEKLADTDLPQGFGFDRFGLMVRKEFAVASAENDTHSLVVPEAASEGDIGTCPAAAIGETFESHTNLGETDVSLSEHLHRMSIEKGDTGQPAPASRPPSRKPQRRARGKGNRADQFCIQRTSDGRNIPAVAIEYKAPHKLGRNEVVTGLASEIQPERDVINKDGEGFAYASKALAAAVVTQLFSYMIGKGIQYGYVCTGEAFVFLHIPDDPTTVRYHACVPNLDVLDNDVNRLHRTAVAQVFAFIIQALRVEPPPPSWHDAAAALDTWAVEYDDVLRKIPESPIQGTHVPVCLGSVDLVLPYYYGSGVFEHFLFLSWAGLPLFDFINRTTKADIVNKVTAAYKRIHRLHILHHDAEPRNIMYDQKSGNVMIVDFERDEFRSRQPLCPLGPNANQRKRRRTQKQGKDDFEKEQESVTGSFLRLMK